MLFNVGRKTNFINGVDSVLLTFMCQINVISTRTLARLGNYYLKSRIYQPIEKVASKTQIVYFCVS